VAEYWPDLAAVLAPARRPAAAKPRQTTGARSAPALGGLYDAFDQEQQEDGHQAAQEAAQDGSTIGSGSTDRDQAVRSEQLVRLLKEALLALDKPQNTTQLIAWLHQRGETSTREEVMHALFAREDLFRKRGAGQWTLVGRDPQP
jgi:hypothetical protein